MAVDETIDTEQLSISPLDEVDAREMREFLLGAQENFWGEIGRASCRERV